jgi:hypothetical protein
MPVFSTKPDPIGGIPPKRPPFPTFTCVLKYDKSPKLSKDLDTQGHLIDGRSISADAVKLDALVAGSGGGSTTKIQEVIIDDTIGDTDTYSISETPVSPSSVSIFVNGLFNIQGVHYNIVGKIITFVAVVPAGYNISATYSVLT